MIYKVKNKQELINVLEKDLEKKDKIIATEDAFEKAMEIYKGMEAAKKEKKKKKVIATSVGTGAALALGFGLTIATGGVGGIAVGAITATTLTISAVTISTAELGMICATALGVTLCGGLFKTNRKGKFKAKAGKFSVEFEVG